MDMQELEISIDKEGRVQVQVRGIQGQECLIASQNIENSLGDVQTRVFLPEYYEQPVAPITCEQIRKG
jgi:hypothetical protein